MSAAAMDAHFAETGAKLIADAGPLAGKTLQYFHIDSWELGQPTWTPRMREEFQRRRGYDPLPWLPAVLGRTVDNAAETRRFLQDYRRTAADLVAANYYGRLARADVEGRLARHASGIRRAVLHPLDRRAPVRGHQRRADGRVLETQQRAGRPDHSPPQPEPQTGRLRRAHLRQADLPGRSVHLVRRRLDRRSVEHERHRRRRVLRGADPQRALLLGPSAAARRQAGLPVGARRHALRLQPDLVADERTRG